MVVCQSWKVCVEGPPFSGDLVAPIKRQIVKEREKERMKREEEKEVFAFLLSCCCLKMENYCMQCPKSAPNFPLKTTHTHTYRHTATNPL